MCFPREGQGLRVLPSQTEPLGLDPDGREDREGLLGVPLTERAPSALQLVAERLFDAIRDPRRQVLGSHAESLGEERHGLRGRRAPPRLDLAHVAHGVAGAGQVRLREPGGLAEVAETRMKFGSLHTSPL